METICDGTVLKDPPGARGVRLAPWIAGLMLVLVFSAEAQALPIFQRLYQKRYGARVPCNACHESFGGTPLNAYGRDYIRAGADSSAFEAIEAKDSDRDGVSNIDEIRARSNPGHPASTVKAPGPWLEKAQGPPIPREWLVRVIPGGENFEAEEASLDDEARAAVEEATGEELAEEETVPTYYYPRLATVSGEWKRVGGHALLVYLPGREGTVVVGVAVGEDDSIQRVVLLRHGGHRAIGDPAFTRQFEGLREDANTWTVGPEGTVRPIEADPEATEAAARAIRRAVDADRTVHSVKTQIADPPEDGGERR